jgi:hypothetical protein
MSLASIGMKMMDIIMDVLAKNWMELSLIVSNNVMRYISNYGNSHDPGRSFAKSGVFQGWRLGCEVLLDNLDIKSMKSHIGGESVGKRVNFQCEASS